MSSNEPISVGRAFPPARSWLPGYERTDLGHDAVGGLTVWALVVPESMAYASIAGVPVEYGLYSVPLAVLGYFLFASSRRLFVGPSATVARAAGRHRRAWSGASRVALSSSMRRPGRSTRAVTRTWSIGTGPSRSTWIRASLVSGRGWQRSIARVSSAATGPPCCMRGLHGLARWAPGPKVSVRTPSWTVESVRE